jgi:hypothetical protein
MIDENLKTWLIEVNTNPDITTSTVIKILYTIIFINLILNSQSVKELYHL